MLASVIKVLEVAEKAVDGLPITRAKTSDIYHPYRTKANQGALAQLELKQVWHPQYQCT